MNKLEDAPHLQAAFDKASDQFGLGIAPESYRITAEHFFIAGYKTAIEERAKFDEQNGLIVNDLCNTHEVIPQHSRGHTGTMKKLEDAPELKTAFNKPLNAALKTGFTFWAHESAIAEHFFIAGRDSVRDECESMKPKRTIAEVHEIDGEIYVVSNDRKMFSWQGNTMGWYALPDLPQDSP